MIVDGLILGGFPKPLFNFDLEEHGLKGFQADPGAGEGLVEAQISQGFWGFPVLKGEGELVYENPVKPLLEIDWT